MMQYELIRGKRKTISISFDKDGNLIVKAPRWVRKDQIERFVEEKREWIENTSARLQKMKAEAVKNRLRLENGDELSFLGQRLVLTVVREDRKQGKAAVTDGRLILHVSYDADYEYKRALVEKWYRKEAAKHLEEKVAEYAGRLQVSYGQIRIKDQKSRWGSCSSQGNLNFNWRIIMAPEAVFDYVVIHEVCHLRHMDHSPEFWKMVGQLCPAYLECKNWLKDHGNRLYLI